MGDSVNQSNYLRLRAKSCPKTNKRLAASCRVSFRFLIELIDSKAFGGCLSVESCCLLDIGNS